MPAPRRKPPQSLSRTPGKPLGRSFSCPNCTHPLTISDHRSISTVSCGACRSIIDATDPNLALLQEASKVQKTPYIPLGTKGKLYGALWKCIGFMERSDTVYHVRWREYLLYNPWKGYRFLFELDGHWTLFQRTRKLPTQSELSAKYLGKWYRLYNKGESRVEYVEGEFFWQVRRGDKAVVADYIRPPFYLSSEFDPDTKEKVWMYGKYIDPQGLKEAFKIQKSPPEQVGVAPNQPWKHKESWEQMWKQFIKCLSLCLIIFLFNGALFPKRVVYSDTFNSQEDPYGRSLSPTDILKTPPFEIKGRTGNVELEVYSSVSNDWLYVDALLVNQATGKGARLPVQVSYYYGSGWSEGSRTNSTITGNIPPGEYYLSFKTRGRYTKNYSYNVKLSRGVPRSSTLIITLILLFLPICLMLVRKWAFNTKRWENSDYSPYHES